MKKIVPGDDIFIKNKKEADFIWNILIKLGYCWNSRKKIFVIMKNFHLQYKLMMVKDLRIAICGKWHGC